MMHALAWSGGRTLWLKYGEGKMRYAMRYVVLSFVLFPVFAAFGTIGANYARMTVEKEGKELVVSHLVKMRCPLLICTNRDHELSVEELERMGVQWEECNSVFIPNIVRLDRRPKSVARWKMLGHTYSLKPINVDDVEAALRDERAPERCTLLYVQTPRARMDTREYWRFTGDFSWAFSHLPEFDREVFIQQIEIQYRGGTVYEDLFMRAGARRYKLEHPYSVLPLNPNELLWRIATGFPLIEDYAYEANSYLFESCGKRGGYGSPQDTP
jgi:hypothetical protein